VREALEEIKKAGLRGLIIDLRGNTGGLIGQAEAVADMFLTEGMIISLSGRHVNDAPRRADPQALIEDEVPVVVLVDWWTGSAAEILAGALQALKRGAVVGTRTIGKGAVTSVFELPDGSAIMLTVAYYELANGAIIEGKGLEPDLVAGAPPQEARQDAEKMRRWLGENYEQAHGQQEQKALEMLKGKLQARQGER
jgi:carboxyl-terminal processing protease